MPRLGEFFDRDAQVAHIARRLTPGHVLWLPNCTIPTPPKPKFAVIVADAGEGPLLILINSRIAPFVEARPDMARRQVRVSAADYPFLSHDSYINCAEVHTSVSWRDILDAADGSVARVEGAMVKAVLDATVKSAMAEAVRGAATITPEHQDIVCRALAP